MSPSPPAHAHSHDSHSQGPPRKKMRKGTKSCIECRRRKIKCTFEPGRTSVCNECHARGSACIDQEHGDISFTNTGTATASTNTTGTNGAVSAVEQGLRERVGNLEDMLRLVLNRLPGKDSEDTPGSNAEETEVHRERRKSVAEVRKEQSDTQAAAEVLKSLRTPVHSSTSTIDDIHLLPSSATNAPALALFDNAILERKEVPVTISRAQYNKSKLLISELLRLLPSPEDLEIILENSQEWWAIWRTMFPHITDKRCVTIKESVSHSLRSQKPAEIAKIMLCIALSINQLPQDFDWSKVSLKESPAELMDRYIATVDRLVTSDDDIAATIDGLECMILEAKYHINLGRPRRSWLLYHRAIAFGQLLGLHRLSLRKPKSPDQEYYRQLMVWTHLVLGDRYLSLILGLPYSVADSFCLASLEEAAEVAAVSAKGEAYLASMAPIMSKLIDRNQSSTTVPYTATLTLDQQVEDIRAKTDPAWWTTDRIPGSSVEEHFDRLQAQFFHYHAKLLMHMPFMLRSSVAKPYQYSHNVTLDSAREMIKYFDALRGAENVGPHICKLLDFQAFTAAMLLLLNLCGYNTAARGAGTIPQQPDLDQDQQDSALIDRTITLLRQAANEPGGVVASQCASALDMMGKVRTGECDAHKEAAANGETCQISIPYFGTISLGVGKAFVPIKPGTYPEAGTVRKSISAPLPKRANIVPQAVGHGLPTPPSMSSGSSQASPSIQLDGNPSPYNATLNDFSQSGGMGSGSISAADNSWTASTEDPFITFDSFMAFPGAQGMDMYDSSLSASTGLQSAGSEPFSQLAYTSGVTGMRAFGETVGTSANVNVGDGVVPDFVGGFPFPAFGGGGSVELDDGWNWFGVDAPVA